MQQTATMATVREGAARMRGRRRHRTQDLEARLQAWGEWMVRPVPGLSYPTASVEGRLMEEGAGALSHGLRHFLPRYEPSPRNAETHRAVLDMPDDWQTVIFLRFALRVKDSEIGRYVDYSRRTYYARIEQAEAFLLGRLGYGYGG